MSTKIKLKKSSIAGRIPNTGDLDFGEIAINYTDGVIYYKSSDNTIKSIRGGSIGVDSAATIALIDSAYVQARQSAGGGTDPIFKTISVAGQSDIVADIVADTLTIAAGSNISLTTNAGTDTLTITGTNLLDSSTVSGVIDSAYVQLRETAQDFAYGSLTGAPTALSSFTNDTKFLDSSTVQGVVDSSYVQLRQTTTDLTNYRTVTQIQSMIDSDVAALVDAAPGTLDTLNELAAALNDDANFATTITTSIATKIDSAAAIGIVDSAYVRIRQDKAYSSLTGTPTVLDSTNVSSIITADVTTSFVNALNVDANTLDGAGAGYYLNYNNFLNTPTIPTLDTDFVDSGRVTTLIDSAYVQLRQSSAAGVTVQDEGSSLSTAGTTLNFVGSGVVASGTGATKTITITGSSGGDQGATTISNFYYTADSGQITFSGNDDAGNNLSYTADKIQVYLNGILLKDSDDYTATTGASIVLSDSADASDILSVITYTTQAVGTLDSTGVLSLINANPTLDSAEVVQLIDSSYVQLRQSSVTAGATTITNFFYTADSGQITFSGSGLTYTAGKIQVYLNGILLKDSDDYTASNGTTITLSDSADANDILSVITYTTQAVGTLDSIQTAALIDSSYIQLRQIKYTNADFLDSSTVTGVINSSYIQTNQIKYTNADFLDSSTVTGVINATYIQSNQTKYDTSDFADSAFVTTQINNVIDAAPGALNTLNELAAALGDDANFSTTITNQIAAKLDSAQAIAIIDSAYINARVTTGTDSATVSAIITADVDAAFVAALGTSAIPNLPTSKITSGTFDSARIPSLSASDIITGTIDSARIPSLAPSDTHGTFADAQIPSLAASKISSGTFDSARIPALASSDIITGTIDSSRLPSLAPSDVHGTFADGQIPSLAASKISSGTFDSARLPIIASANNANTLGSIEPGSFLRSDANDTFTGILSGAGSIAISGPISTTDSAVFGGNGSTGGVKVDDGAITIRTGTGSVAYVDFYCEVSNAHRTRLKSAAHSEYSGNVDITLPVATGTLLTTDGSGASLTNLNASNLGSGTVPSARLSLGASDIPNLATSKITSGTFDSARIPSLSASDIITGTIDSARLPTGTFGGGGGGGGSSITVQEEGSSLSTAATTLNFVGSAVTASGTGSTKTITITGGSGIDSAGVTNIISNGVGINNTSYVYTATASQAVYTGADDNGNTLSYTAGSQLVYLNGILLVDSADYTAANGTTITLTTGANVNDVISIVSSDTTTTYNLNTNISNFYYTSTGSQTTFSGSDDNSNTLAYTADKIQVYLNGVLLKDSADYTATNGTSVVLSSAVDSNDVIAISAYTNQSMTTLDSSGIISIINANPTGLDSAAATALIDSSYVAARSGSGGGVTLYPAYDSAEALLLIDSSTITSGTLAYIDKANVFAIWNDSDAKWYQVSFEEFAIGDTPAGSGGTESDLIVGATTYKVHTFTSSGNFVVSKPINGLEYLVIAGGGSGSGYYYGGGGGAGGYRTNVSGQSSGGGGSAESTMNLIAGTYAVVVGAGGAEVVSTNSNGNAGSNSSFNLIVSTGGGEGGRSGGAPGSGGSGGGGGGTSSGGSGTSNQGYAGGNGGGAAGSNGAGGGGGAGAVGTNGGASSAGAGGTGVQSDITGTGVYRAGGGGGSTGAFTYSSNTGGTGGGGDGGSYTQRQGAAGTTNTGSGGGGGTHTNAASNTGGAGGSGVVILRYAI